MQRTATRTLTSAAAVGIGLGAITGIGLAAWLASLNGWGAGRDALVLALHLAGTYALLFVVAFSALAGVLVVLGLRPGLRPFVAVAAAGTVWLNAVLRYNLAVQFASVTPHMTWLGVFDLVTLSLAAFLVFLALLARSAPRVLAGLGAAVALVVGVHFANAGRETPIERDLAVEVPRAVAQAPVERPAPAADRFSEARLVLLGIDGLSFEVLLPLLREGAIPNFRYLLQDAAYGYLETSALPISPVVWETIATGQSRWKHGIGYHVHFDFAGVHERVRALPEFKHGNSPMLLRRLLTGLAPWAPWERVPSSSRDARVARFYDVAAAHGISVGSFNWLNTGPTYPIHGWLRGSGPIAPHFYPPELEGEVEHVDQDPPPPPAGADRLAIVRHYELQERKLYHQFVEIALERPAELLMYYTHFADGVNHTNWKEDVYGNDFFIRGYEGVDIEPGEAIRTALRFVDDVLGDVLARLPEDATLVILSDHGFGFRGCEHDCGPPGVFIARGPGVRPGLVQGADLVDVAPTLLHWLGLQVAEDMDGQVLPIAVPGGPLDRPVQHVASYGPGPGVRKDGKYVTDEDELRRHEEYLRRLGYVN